MKLIKDSKKKVQASIQGDLVRVSGKDRDTLQEMIALLARPRFRHRHAVHQLPLELMARRIESLFINGPAGRLEALLEEPEDHDPRRGRAGLPSASAVRRDHAQQGGLSDRARIAARRCGGAAIQLSRRELERGKYDDGVGEMEDARAALTFLRSRYPELPFALAGFSFGSRIILKLGC